MRTPLPIELLWANGERMGRNTEKGPDQPKDQLLHPVLQILVLNATVDSKVSSSPVMQFWGDKGDLKDLNYAKR